MDRSENIDRHGFRPNVCTVIQNDAGQVLWARRVGGRDAWQFPQGGIHAGESAKEAMYRELFEEVGLTPEAVEIVASTSGWLRYRLPRYMRRRGSHRTARRRRRDGDSVPGPGLPAEGSLPATPNRRPDDQQVASASAARASRPAEDSVRFLGQKQKWFLLRLLAGDDAVRTDHTPKPEFDHWRWVSYWYPLAEVVAFKRDVYRRALTELAPMLQVTQPQQDVAQAEPAADGSSGHA